MAIGDSLEKLIASRRTAGPDPAGAAWLAQKEEIFAPVVRRLRVMIGGIDARFLKSRLTRQRAVIRVGNGEIDAGWDIAPNSARNIDADAPLLKLVETRDFMSDNQSTETAYFDDEDALIEHLERRITERITRYRHTV